MKTILLGLIGPAVIMSLGLLCCSLPGCGPTEKGLNSNESVPPDAKNIKHLGNNWYTFELDLNGKTHKFLYLQWRAVTEIGGNP